VAHEKAQTILDKPTILRTLGKAFARLDGDKQSAITLDLTIKDSQHIDIIQSYTDPYPETLLIKHHNTRYPIRPFQAAWNLNNYIYTDGSQKTGNLTLGAAIVNTATHTTTHIDVKSQPERQTINRAELTAITLTLEIYHDSPQLRILIDSAFSINTIRNYIIDPLNYKHHPHRDLLMKANNHIQKRDQQGLTTHIGKVKSHTGVTHNDTADAGARGVVDGDVLPDITFTEADPHRRHQNMARNPHPYSRQHHHHNQTNRPSHEP
jgi:ribonuclease HI